MHVCVESWLRPKIQEGIVYSDAKRLCPHHDQLLSSHFPIPRDGRFEVQVRAKLMRIPWLQSSIAEGRNQCHQPMEVTCRRNVSNLTVRACSRQVRWKER
jgi:hypothetical protein